MSVQKFAYDALKSYAGVMVASNLNVADKMNLGNNLAAKSITSGVIYATISDAINYASGQRSKIAVGDVYGLVDDAGYFSALSAVSRITGADQQVYQTLSRVSPFGPQVNVQLLETGIITGGRFLGDYIVATPSAPDMLKKLRRPTTIFSK